jgi:hypothetical protein
LAHQTPPEEPWLDFVARVGSFVAGDNDGPLADPALRDRDFVDYRADSALRAQIDVACAAASLARRTAAEHGRIHADPFEI